ncbi:MAG: phosphotransferase [Deltaproteobacteria bacterium]|nr:phosphotransferase [Deltaproteobacteria bacterium]
MQTTEAQSVDAESEARIREVIGRWEPARKDCLVLGMTPDASLRRYFRVRWDSGRPASALAMVFLSLAVPEAVGKHAVNSYDSYVQLTHFLSRHGVSVPTLYFESEAPPILILEDLGDVMLADVLLGRAGQANPEDRLARLYSRACEIIVEIQRIPSESGFFPFERGFTEEIYVNEMSETLDFLLRPLDASPDRYRVFEEASALIADELGSFPKILAHRDFHSWNLMVDPSEQVRVIDFQDALLATGSYDLVSLLNDRDADSALGDRLYVQLVQGFYTAAGSRADFYAEYDRALLQRDLKVAGRFAKLSTVRGLTTYAAWIPGTLRRIGRTLERITASGGQHALYGSLLELLCDHFPEVKAGALNPLRFDAPKASE